VEPNSPSAVANVENERVGVVPKKVTKFFHRSLIQDYFDLLDSKCEEFKAMPGGGVGWFAHIYSDSQEPGYGILNGTTKEKFPFRPRTSC
jgi:hypothetical protein